MRAKPRYISQGPGKEDLRGQVRLPGLPQLLWVKPGTVVGLWAAPDTGVAGGDCPHQPNYHQMWTI